ncbi:Uncharacterized protein Adt_31561 [Abeliophyllum distichum]|uniref:Uncharacterized protein n=1 Tax=Abeliophyllum distichum TaxID=126358 RepID=A0ABD1REG4_9LAMI
MPHSFKELATRAHDLEIQIARHRSYLPSDVHDKKDPKKKIKRDGKSGAILVEFKVDEEITITYVYPEMVKPDSDNRLTFYEIMIDDIRVWDSNSESEDEIGDGWSTFINAKFYLEGDEFYSAELSAIGFEIREDTNNDHRLIAVPSHQLITALPYQLVTAAEASRVSTSILSIEKLCISNSSKQNIPHVKEVEDPKQTFKGHYNPQVKKFEMPDLENESLVN